MMRNMAGMMKKVQEMQDQVADKEAILIIIVQVN